MKNSLLFLALVSLSTPAFASGWCAIKDFEELDTDGDNVLSYAEFFAGFPDATPEDVIVLDRNNDGWISITEYYHQCA